MSVQRKPQDRSKVEAHRGRNPRSYDRKVATRRHATRAELEQELGVTFGNHPLDTRQGLIAVGLLRPGVCFSTLPRERARRHAESES